jgi:hypothetical protein
MYIHQQQNDGIEDWMEQIGMEWWMSIYLFYMLKQKVNLPFNSFYQVKDGEIRDISNISIPNPPQRLAKGNALPSLLLEWSWENYAGYIWSEPKIGKAKVKKKRRNCPDLEQPLTE